MNKTDLINVVAEKTGQTKKAANASIIAVFDAITAELAKGGKVQLIGFGTFEVRERSARMGRDIRTGEPIKIATSKVPAFKAGKALKAAVKK